eukprot:Gregarina_sp_Poly_1__350@NODE_1085_length_5145_cov_250_530327_g753_i0_p6_GENE_NODE_1085_length_5145_cov_250_530327_g753_i0NODE_1085_length_5145_cov_250_530327_g753_i0_p6_ORF_typecomplete_len110_score9_04_NODE_1085_length_5145_cov_250_530327_g753_i017442073
MFTVDVESRLHHFILGGAKTKKPPLLFKEPQAIKQEAPGGHRWRRGKTNLTNKGAGIFALAIPATHTPFCVKQSGWSSSSSRQCVGSVPADTHNKLEASKLTITWPDTG